MCTKWMNFREDYLPVRHGTNQGSGSYDVVYRRDAKGNIVQVILAKDGRYNPQNGVAQIKYTTE